MKKLSSIFLSAVMLCLSVFYVSPVLYATDENPETAFTPVFEQAEAIQGRIDLTPHIDVIKSGEFTVETTFTTTQTALGALFTFNKGAESTPYFAVYLKEGRIGYETNPKQGEVVLGNTLSNNLKDGRPHTIQLSFSLLKREFFILLDQNLVHHRVLTQEELEALSRNFFPHITHASVGKGRRSNQENFWPITATFAQTKLYAQALDKEIYYHRVRDHQMHEESDGRVIERIKSLKNLTLTTTFLGNPSLNKSVAFKLDDAGNKKFEFYFDPSRNTVGLDYNNGTQAKDYILPSNFLENKGVHINDGKVHTLTLLHREHGEHGGPSYEFYIDGVFIDKYSSNAFHINAIEGLNHLQVADANNAPYILDAVVLPGAISPQMVTAFHKTKTADRSITAYAGYLGDPKPLFYRGYDNSSNYRIPSLMRTQAGTQIAMIDKRQSGAHDYGNIDISIRRKERGQQDFGPAKVIMDMPNGSQNGYTALTIDAAMLQTPDGTIYALVDMFPQSKALMGLWANEPLAFDSGYQEINGKHYLKLYTEVNNAHPEGVGEAYTVRENGVVYNPQGEPTDYRVNLGEYSVAPYHEFGSLYKAGEYKGNIYYYSGNITGELKAVKTTYLWLLKSTDDGLTWEKPRDITPQVKPAWSDFTGVGPGRGLTMANGHLAFPVYSINRSGIASQSSHLILSQDNGETWHLGESPLKVWGYDPSTGRAPRVMTEAQALQLNNGDLVMFMRSHGGGTRGGPLSYAISKDFGETWTRLETFGPAAVNGRSYDPATASVFESDTQMSSVHFEYKGKEYIVHSGPGTWRRSNGTLNIAEITYNDINEAIFTWHPRKLHAPGDYAYSSMTYLGDGRLALLYEGPRGDLFHKEFDMEYLLSELQTEDVPAPQFDTVRSGFAMFGENYGGVLLYTKHPSFMFSNPRVTLEINGQEYRDVILEDYGDLYAATVGDLTSISSVTLKSIDTTHGKILNVNGLPLEVSDLSLEPFRTVGEEALQTHIDAKDMPALIAEAEASLEKFRAGSRAVVEAAIERARYSLENKNSFTQANFELEVAKLSQALREAIHSSVFADYKASVLDLYPEANYSSVYPDLYSKIQDLESKLENGTIVSRQEQLNEIMKLRHYVETLPLPTVNKAALQAFYDKAVSKQKGEYTSQSFNTFAAALDQAEKTLQSDTVTQGKINQDLAQLEAAFNNLQARQWVPARRAETDERTVNVTSKYKEETFEEEDKIFFHVEKKESETKDEEKYDLSFQKEDGTIVQPKEENPVVVRLPIETGRTVREIKRDHEGEISTLAHKVVEDETGKFVEFETDRFSLYTLIYQPLTDENPHDDTGAEGGQPAPGGENNGGTVVPQPQPGTGNDGANPGNPPAPKPSDKSATTEPWYKHINPAYVSDYFGALVTNDAVKGEEKDQVPNTGIFGRTCKLKIKNKQKWTEF